MFLRPPGQSASPSIGRNCPTRSPPTCARKRSPLPLPAPCAPPWSCRSLRAPPGRSASICECVPSVEADAGRKKGYPSSVLRRLMPASDHHFYSSFSIPYFHPQCHWKSRKPLCNQVERYTIYGKCHPAQIVRINGWYGFIGKNFGRRGTWNTFWKPRG